MAATSMTPSRMMAATSVGESQLQRIIRDLRDAVAELSREHRESGEPVTDDSSSLHKFSYKLEYLLQFDQKEKKTLLGTRKDYWDYFTDCLAKVKGANDGIRYVKSIPELKTSLGKGRAFIRYSLVHQRLADTLQQCLMNQGVTSDWYYARSPFLKSHLSGDIIHHLYELNEVQFDVASRGHDLDSAWPTFARRTLGSGSSLSHLWRTPSRSSSVNSLASNYSQIHEFLCSPDLSHGLSELSEPAACNAVEDLRIELDQSELKQQQLLERVRQLGEEATELRGLVRNLQGQLETSAAPSLDVHRGLQQSLLRLEQDSLEKQRELEVVKQESAEQLQAVKQELEALRAKEASERHLEAKLSSAEWKNMELLAKLDGALDEKGQQTASHFDSAQKIHALLDKLNEAEKEKLEALKEAEERRREAVRLAEELRLKEVSLGEGELRLGDASTSAREESSKTLRQVEELQNDIYKLQGALTVKEKESTNLQMQLQDLQSSLEERERQVEELKRKTQEEKEELQQRYGNLKESLEAQVHFLTEQLEAKEKDLSASAQKAQLLERQAEKLLGEKACLSGSVVDLQGNAKDQVKKIEDYRKQCNSLMELNSTLLQTVKKNEETKKDLAESRVVLESELASLWASEKQLRSKMNDATLTVGLKEKTLREENQQLEESYQRVSLQKERAERTAKGLEQENYKLKEEQLAVKGALSSTLEELSSVSRQISELEKNLLASRRNEARLREQLQEKCGLLEGNDALCNELQGMVEELEGRAGGVGEKADEENKYSSQCNLVQSTEAEKRLTKTAHVQGSSGQEVTYGLSVVEGQLDLNVKEVSRLQTEVVDLRRKLLIVGKDKLKTQARLDVVEDARDKLRTLAEQLKVHVEELNHQHVGDLLNCEQKEEALQREKEAEALASAHLASDLASAREELSSLKKRNEELALENAETKDCLHRTNTEMAELGIQVCSLTAEREGARQRLVGMSAQLQELEEEAAREVDRLNASVATLHRENASLREELRQSDGLSAVMLDQRERLEQAEGRARRLQESAREEMDAVRFQMSCEAMNHQNQLQVLNEELENVKEKLGLELAKVSGLEMKVSELEAANCGYVQLLGERNDHIVKTKSVISQNEEELQFLKNNLSSAEQELAATREVCRELGENLHRTRTEKQSCDMKMSAEIDDLYRTKKNLEERLIELIRDKDALWQKSDALEFEQKLRAEDLMDREANHCLDCQSLFSWWLRRHACGLCGRAFCYYCSNNTVTTSQEGKRERCCRQCYTQHSAVVERLPEPGMISPPYTPVSPSPNRPKPSVTVTDPAHRPDDGVFDIITEDEVSGIYGSDSPSQTAGETPEKAGETEPHGGLDLSTSVGDTASDDTDDLSPVVQDAEIYLLKSGELTLTVPLSVEEISAFGDTSQELFVRSSCYSAIPIAAPQAGPTIGWVFSSEPKSISFSVIYSEAGDVPLEHSKVLIPLTRCNSHKETIQGQMKIRNPGTYTLIFDNSFSRFISKKVLYHLTIAKPVIYDGSDLS